MTFLNKIPGPLLIFLGATCLSFGGLIVKSFEGANLWQILFWRQTFFAIIRSEEHTSELQSRTNLVCRLLLEKKKKKNREYTRYIIE